MEKLGLFDKLFGKTTNATNEKLGGNEMVKIGIILGSTREGRVSPQVGAW